MVMRKHEPSAANEGTGHGPQGGSAQKPLKGQAQSLALVMKFAIIEKIAWEKVGGRHDEAQNSLASRLLKNTIRLSLPRRRESRKARKDWIPAFAGMTTKTAKTSFSATD